jgi:hypothetical protein
MHVVICRVVRTFLLSTKYKRGKWNNEKRTTVKIQPLTNYQTNYMVQSPSWEAHSHLAGQEMSCFLWNLKVYYHVLNNMLLYAILNQSNPIYTSITYLYKINFNVIL